MNTIITLLSLIVFLLLAGLMLFVYSMCKVASMGDTQLTRGLQDDIEQDRRELEEMQDEVEE
jgi:hypothetical protein